MGLNIASVAFFTNQIQRVILGRQLVGPEEKRAREIGLAESV